MSTSLVPAEGDTGKAAGRIAALRIRLPGVTRGSRKRMTCAGRYPTRRWGEAQPMNTNQAIYFKALYELRHVVAAARSIPISRQGLRKAIESLESELGVTLFVRNEDGGVTPTPYGEAFKDYLDDDEALIARFRNEVRLLREAENATIHLACASGAMGVLGQAFFTPFIRKHPDITIEHTDMADLDVDDGIFDGRFNLGITVAPFNGAFETIPLHSTPRSLWVRRDDPLARKETLTIGDLDGYCVGIVPDRYKNYQEFMEACSIRNVHPREIAEWSELFWLFCYARERNHVSFTVQSAAKQAESDPLLTEIPLENSSWTFGLSYLRGHRLRPEEHDLVEHCRAWASTHAKDIPPYQHM